MRVMVTGATGFIGRRVVAAARARNHEVVALVRGPNPAVAASWDAGVQVTPGDLRHPEGLGVALAGCDAVIHCAAAMDGDLATQRDVTVEGTRHLVSAMRIAGVTRLVSLGTFAIYDYLRLPVDAVLDEESPLEASMDSRAPYIRAKWEQEQVVREAAAAGQWRCVILRPGIVYGSGRTWFHHLGMQLGTRLWVGLAGRSTLPLIEVDGCAVAVVAALDVATAGVVTLNLVDDALPNRREYLRALADRTTPRPIVLTVPWAVLSAASRVASWVAGRKREALPDLLRPGSLAARCKPLRYSNARARSVLDWEPGRDIGMGLDRSFAEPPSA